MSLSGVIGLARPAASRTATATRAAQSVTPGSFAALVEEVTAAPPSATVADGLAAAISRGRPPRDRSLLRSFLGDLAAAPEIAGELVALYIEQHPRLALRFVKLALMLRPGAAAEIEAAARWREVCGATQLADVIRGAALLATPPEPEPSPAVILDLRDDDLRAAYYDLGIA